LSHTYPVDPEPTTPRKLPAPLASFACLRVSIGVEASALLRSIVMRYLNVLYLEVEYPEVFDDQVPQTTRYF
jgi:hypothetical protein